MMRPAQYRARAQAGELRGELPEHVGRAAEPARELAQLSAEHGERVGPVSVGMLGKIVGQPHVAGGLEAEDAKLQVEPGARLCIRLCMELKRVEHVVAACDDHLETLHANADA